MLIIPKQIILQIFNINYLKFIQLLFNIVQMRAVIPKVSNYSGTNSGFAKALLATSAVSILVSASKYFQSKKAQSEIKFRKQQLQKPIVKLSEQEMVNPPWNSSNIDQWLYRRVQVTGRPIHRLACMIPRVVSGGFGSEYVVPLVARENQDRSQPQGIIFSKGFIPAQFERAGHRARIQDVSKQTFVGFVSKLQQLQNKSIWSGNAYQPGRLKYTCADIEDFVKSAGFTNKKQASVAVVEKLHEMGEVNERRGKRYAHDCDFAEDYPYSKTESGALQLPQMPWDLRQSATNYFAISLTTFVMGASIF